VPSFSGIFKPIGNVFKGLSSAKFASIINNVVMPIAGVAVGIKNAKSQSLPPAPPVQPASVAPNAANAAGAAGGKPWYTNPVVYLGGAAVVLLGALVLSRRSG
jgi:hypothetical protein